MQVSNSSVKEADDYIDFLSTKEHLNTGEMRVYIESRCSFLKRFLEETYEVSLDGYSVTHLYPALRTKGIKPIKAHGPYQSRSVYYWKRQDLDRADNDIRNMSIKLLREQGVNASHVRHTTGQGWVGSNGRGFYTKLNYQRVHAHATWALDIALEALEAR